MALILLYLTFALGISFLCSFLEAILLSTPISYITMKENEGVKGASRLKNFKTNIDRPISAILSLNTVAHTIGAAGVGAEAVKVFGEAYFGLISAVLTLLILIFSEIIPKTIGATYWRTLAIPASKIIQFMIYLCYPLVWLSEFITKAFARKGDEKTVSREEVSAMVDVGVQEGVFQSEESRIIQNLMRLDHLTVCDVMTPHTVTQIANGAATLRDLYDDSAFKPYSRIPIYEGQRDCIVGYVLFKDVLAHLADDKFQTKVADIQRPIIVVKEGESISAVWEKMLEAKEHIALVVNQFGTFEGIITMEDVVETILGLEIIDESDTVIDMQQLAREKWQARSAKYKQLMP